MAINLIKHKDYTKVPGAGNEEYYYAAESALAAAQDYIFNITNCRDIVVQMYGDASSAATITLSGHVGADPTTGSIVAEDWAVLATCDASGGADNDIYATETAPRWLKISWDAGTANTRGFAIETRRRG